MTAKSRRLAGAIARVAHKDEVSIRKPAHQARQQQPDNVRWRLMTRAMHTIPLGGTVQSHQDGEGPRACRERQFHEHRHDDPLMPPAIGDIAVGRAYPIAMPSLAKHLGAWVLGDRIVASQQHRPGRNYMVQQERDQGTSECPGRPSALGKHPMIRRDMPLRLKPNGAKQVGDGSSPRRQHRREYQDQKPVIRRGGKRGPKHHE